ncbi:hypothetical protein ABID16_003651 [Rhizobium aquaticum]|uniref:Uncharacterized protein n=1 Tax=Rhizobium aquaticum TaxID=1549636 RepID=A0ABV2J3H6_9HYPH
MNMMPKTPLSPVFASAFKVHHVHALQHTRHHAHRSFRRSA